MYEVYGDYGYVSEKRLMQTYSYAEAMKCFRFYAQKEDLHGFKVVEVASFDDDGEYVTHECVHKEE